MGRKRLYRYLHRIAFALSLIGILVAVHLIVQQHYGFARGCLSFIPENIDAAFSCKKVVESEAGTLIGISNSVWGVIFYLTLSVLYITLLFINRPFNSRFNQLPALLIGGGFIYTLYLSYYQSFVLGEYCLLCIISASLVVLLLILEGFRQYQLKKGGRSSETVETDTSLYPNKQREQMIHIGALCVIILIGSADYIIAIQQGRAGTGTAPEAHTSMEFNKDSLVISQLASLDIPQETSRCSYLSADKERVESYRSLIKFYDPTAGPDTASVHLLFFFDPAEASSLSVLSMMQKLVKKQNSGLQVIFKPIATSGESVERVELLYYVTGNNKFSELINGLNDLPSPSLSADDTLHRLAEQTGLDIETMKGPSHHTAFYNRMKLDRKQIAQLGLPGTPSIIINGRIVHPKSLTFKCLNIMVNRAAEKK